MTLLPHEGSGARTLESVSGLWVNDPESLVADREAWVPASVPASPLSDCCYWLKPDGFALGFVRGDLLAWDVTCVSREMYS